MFTHMKAIEGAIQCIIIHKNESIWHVRYSEGYHTMGSFFSIEASVCRSGLSAFARDGQTRLAGASCPGQAIFFISYTLKIES